MKLLRKVLVANRGEIAARILRTCRDMGIATVAVFSDADADAPFVRDADEAVRLGPAPAAESYLRIDRLLEAARLTGADAIHPGYGFLAENPALAEACAEAGVVFIGPDAEVIRLLGSKRASKAVVAEAGVPVVPGYAGTDQSEATLQREAVAVGFPLLLKASAGGGGKGMRIVRAEAELPAAIAAARREAASAFGDDTLLIERYIESPRHVEIQILGDSHGTIVHLLERECSIQRRHQKIIEETPSVALDPALRATMGAAAVKVGRAVGYQNAGTVEFILAPDGSFYFLEVNTRLQVEHPVTECVTGLDLVREQIRVAQGQPLDIDQDAVRHRGAAVECRLYAEDPDHGFLPTSGRVIDWHVPVASGLRVDTGIETGTEIGIHYDPMLAKVITHAATRLEATEKMIWALERLAAHGVTTNRELLLRVLRHPAYIAGELDTHFLDRHAADLAAPAPDPADLHAAAIAATLAAHEARRGQGPLPALEPGYRNNPFGNQTVTYASGDHTICIEYRNLGNRRFHVAGAGPAAEPIDITVAAATPTTITLEDPRGLRRPYRIARAGARLWVQTPAATIALTEAPRFPDPTATAVAGGCTAPMPGKVIHLLVAEGDTVTTGQPVLILEAMKMEHPVKAPTNGTITQLAVTQGQQVETDQLLAIIEGTELPLSTGENQQPE